MTEISELLERVKAATGADRELDAAMFELLGEHPRHILVGTPGLPIKGKAIKDEPGVVRAWDKVACCGWEIEAPPYTNSIDAALALMERRLPGCRWALEMVNRPKGFMLTLSHGTSEDFIQARGLGATAPLAILAALLTALQETQK